MALTTPPTAPNRSNPVDFSVAMDDWLAWFNAMVPEFQALSLMTGSGAFTAGTVSAPGMTFSGDTDTGIWRPAANTIAVSTGGAEAFRVSSAGLLLIGTTNTILEVTGAALQAQATAVSKAHISLMLAQATSSGPALDLIHTRGAALDDYTILQAGDNVGSLIWRGGDGSTTILSAQILAPVEGTPASGNVRAGISLRTGSGAGAVTEALKLDTSQRVLATAPAGLGYGTGAGGTVTQGTSRTTGVTINKPTGAITLFSAAGSTTAASFTVTNSLVAATDNILLSQKSGTNKYILAVTAVAAGSFEVTFYTTGGTATDAPVINFALFKGVTA